jgi:hypothetical protein
MGFVQYAMTLPILKGGSDMLQPIYQDIFEIYAIETEDAYYNLGILYKIVKVKGGELLKIEKIHIEEV